MTIKLTIPGMACSACANNITNAVKTIDANATIEADPQTKFVSVETQASETASEGRQPSKYRQTPGGLKKLKLQAPVDIEVSSDSGISEGRDYREMQMKRLNLI